MAEGLGADLEARRAELRRRFPTWTPMTLHERLAQCAAAYGDRPFVITDGRLVTGQNPASSGPAARLLIDTLKKAK